MDKLKELRLKRLMTQRELAELAGVSVWTVRSYEQGKRRIAKANHTTLRAICETLKCDISEIEEVR